MLIGGAYSIVKGSKNVVKSDEGLKENNANSDTIVNSNADLKSNEHNLNNKNSSDGVGIAGNKTEKAASDRVGKKSSEVTSDITRIDNSTSNTNIKHNVNSSNDGIVVAGGSEIEKLNNKLNHIFNKKEHKLDDFLNKFENNQQQAYSATIKKLEKDMAKGKLPNNFTSGYKVNIKGFEVTVRGVIKNGKPEIGTMFIP